MMDKLETIIEKVTEGIFWFTVWALRILVLGVTPIALIVGIIKGGF